jgi:hypothetical protein
MTLRFTSHSLTRNGKLTSEGSDVGGDSITLTGTGEGSCPSKDMLPVF